MVTRLGLVMAVSGLRCTVRFSSKGLVTVVTVLCGAVSLLPCRRRVGPCLPAARAGFGGFRRSPGGSWWPAADLSGKSHVGDVNQHAAPDDPLCYSIQTQAVAACVSPSPGVSLVAPDFLA